MVSAMPAPENYDKKLIKQFEDVKEVVTQIRSIRKDKNIPHKDALQLMVRSTENGTSHEEAGPLIKKLANLSDISQVDEDPGNTVSFIVKNVEYFVPVGDMVNVEEELEKLETELDYTRGFLQSVQKKMSNERFVQNAPAQVVDMERQKMADAEGKIVVLEAQIKKLKEQA